MLPTILIVEYDDCLRGMMRRWLSVTGSTVHAVGSAGEALLFLQSEPVDLVLSDEMMPGMLGHGFLAEVSRRWPDTERILMSGGCDMRPVREGLERGDIGHFVPKPPDPKRLLAEVQIRATTAYLRRSPTHT